MSFEQSTQQGLQQVTSFGTKNPNQGRVVPSAKIFWFNTGFKKKIPIIIMSIRSHLYNGYCIQNPITIVLFWKQLRLLLLAFTFGCTLFAVGKATLDPSNGTYTTFVFPTTVSLPGWESLGSSPLNNQNPNHKEFMAGRRYQYIYNGVPLDIEMRYERSTGDIKAFIQNYTSIPASPTFLYEEQQSVGYYVLFTYQNRAYLSSCINPRGESTVTREQFIKNHNIYNLQFNHLFSWILGQEDLRDWRCLWTNISIPSNNTSVEQSYQVLKNVWFLWYKWWSPRFPKI